MKRHFLFKIKLYNFKKIVIIYFKVQTHLIRTKIKREGDMTMTRNITMTSRKVLAILLSAAMLVSVAVVAIVHSTRSNAATPSSQLYVGYNEEDGNWYAYNIVTGEIQGDYTGIAANENGWWRIEKGKVNFEFTGLAENDNGWYYLENGAVNFEYEGIVSNQNGYWYVRYGTVAFDYTGFLYVYFQGEYGYYYVLNGQVRLRDTGIAQYTDGSWWYYENGKINFDYNGTYTYNGVTYKITDGHVDTTYTGMATNPNGSIARFDNGAINSRYNGIARLNGVSYYVRRGVAKTNDSGKIIVNGKTYTVQNGVIVG